MGAGAGDWENNRRELNQHHRRHLSSLSMVLGRGCQWSKHQKQEGTFANGNAHILIFIQ